MYLLGPPPDPSEMIAPAGWRKRQACISGSQWVRYQRSTGRKLLRRKPATAASYTYPYR